MISDVIRNMAIWVDGRGYAGNCQEFEPPKLSLKMEEVRNAGMDAPVEIEMGQELMEATATFTSFDRHLLSLWGLAIGGAIGITARAALVSENGDTVPLIVNLTGIVKELDQGTWKPGEKVELKMTISCRYYKETWDETVVTEIDTENMIRSINGVDVLAAQRVALGL